MKKWLAMLIFIGFALAIGTSEPFEIIYTDDEPFRINLQKEELNVLQITDLHLAFGIDYRDQKTFKLIRKLTEADSFDLIVVTGDITMSPQAPMLFRQFIRFMETLKTPWTFVFGNHETDFHTYSHFIKQIKNTQYLYFKVGPYIPDGGVGNFAIEFFYQQHPFYKAYFLDSKAERKIYTEEEGEYDYLSLYQVAWYEQHVEQDTTDSWVFMHIPLRQFIEVGDDLIGLFLERKVYAQGKDTGFFDAMVRHGRSKAVFVGHDHLNDFLFLNQGILLAYGRVTGYNAYGYINRGGRVIHVDSSGHMVTSIITDKEVFK